ncbi:MAG: FAD:protein FMN transferase [Candidatus Saccharimonas sp.]|nr:FAD:protein FMN transferase [Planctomycetaceae bacterium]
MSDPSPTSRRDFLSGRAVRSGWEHIQDRLADHVSAAREVPSRGPTLLLRTVAMACDFDVMLNPDGPAFQVEAASEALELVQQLEQLLSVYRDDAHLATINRTAADSPVEVDAELHTLLRRSEQICADTVGAFDPAAGALVSLWRRCRHENRIPTADEIEVARAVTGLRHVCFDDSKRTVRFDAKGVEFNLGAIGKGHAVDRAGEHLLQRGVSNWLVHGGRSSVRAQGTHAGLDGWPVGLRNPLLPDKPFGTLLLKDAALSTSGTAVQWFRHEGKRYGHILDPRTGWPVETMLSVSVIAPDAALADALSTAFFVLGVENALACCDNFPLVGAVFFPPPKQGQLLEPILHNVPEDRLFVAG